jgi:hypothetical protein
LADVAVSDDVDAVDELVMDDDGACDAFAFFVFFVAD